MPFNVFHKVLEFSINTFELYPVDLARHRDTHISHSPKEKPFSLMSMKDTKLVGVIELA